MPDFFVTKRFKGTANYTKEKNIWRLYVTDTETHKVVEEVEAPARNIDTAIMKAKDMARKWEKDNA